MAKNNNQQKTAEKVEYKPGAYVCIVDGEGCAFFNKRRYKYGDRVVVEEEGLVKQMMSAGPRFIPEEEFEKADKDLIKKIRSASSNNKTVEDVVRSSELEKQQLKNEYEAQIEELKKKLEAKEAAKNPEKETAPKGDDK